MYEAVTSLRLDSAADRNKIKKERKWKEGGRPRKKTDISPNDTLGIGTMAAKNIQPNTGRSSSYRKDKSSSEGVAGTGKYFP